MYPTAYSYISDCVIYGPWATDWQIQNCQHQPYEMLSSDSRWVQQCSLLMVCQQQQQQQEEEEEMDVMLGCWDSIIMYHLLHQTNTHLLSWNQHIFSNHHQSVVWVKFRSSFFSVHSFWVIIGATRCSVVRNSNTQSSMLKYRLCEAILPTVSARILCMAYLICSQHCLG